VDGQTTKNEVTNVVTVGRTLKSVPMIVSADMGRKREGQKAVDGQTTKNEVTNDVTVGRTNEVMRDEVTNDVTVGRTNEVMRDRMMENEMTNDFSRWLKSVPTTVNVDVERKGEGQKAVDGQTTKNEVTNDAMDGRMEAMCDRTMMMENEMTNDFSFCATGKSNCVVDKMTNDAMDGRKKVARWLCSREVIDLTEEDVARKKIADNVDERCTNQYEKSGRKRLLSATDSISAGYGVDGHCDERMYVWGGKADVYDVMEIKKMLANGSGVYGCRNCKLEVNNSLLENAGRGVFLKQGCILNHGECLTEYSGQIIRTVQGCSRDEQLRTVEVGGLKILGNKVLKWGDGFGSLLNSSVVGRTISFARFVTYDKRVFIMVHNMKNQYPLRGYIELYITVGQGWWSLFNSSDKC